MRSITIPSQFVRARTRLSWNEAKYALDRGWLDAQSMIDLALNALEEKADNSPLEARLAGLHQNEIWEVSELVDQLAKLEPNPSTEETKKKWLCLILAWFYDSRGDFDDPLTIVDEIYAHFDYPEEIRGFVSYMPSQEPSSTPPYEAETPRARLLRLWKEYLNRCHEKTEQSS